MSLSRCEPWPRGPRIDLDGRVRVTAFQPGALTLELVDSKSHRVLTRFERLHPDGLYEAKVEGPIVDYRLRARWEAGGESVFDDPYRHPSLLEARELADFAAGQHIRPQRLLGAEPCESLGVSGVRFAVWAPRAGAVSVVGDFNFWNERQHPMRLHEDSGIWELFIPGVAEGALYKFAVCNSMGAPIGQKSDPFARRSEAYPGTASVVARLAGRVQRPEARVAANAIDAPMSIYEVHLPSWRRPKDSLRRFLDWDELAAELVPYVRQLGFTHVELLPPAEHPFDGSWGYQPVGLYAPTSRHGEPAGFERFVSACHRAGLGVLIDWVPGHFPNDAHGLVCFDGEPLYEYSDPREGVHQDWDTLIYDFSKPQVRSFLIGSALHWVESYGIDGMRVDAVASMLYRDYSRRDGEWLPNVNGGRENLEAIGFLRQLNSVVAAECPGTLMIAEESTAFPKVTEPVEAGGLGFSYKWNMGWMNDSLRYFARSPEHRAYHHDEITFSLLYAFSERYLLPISHDEVVHGKGSLIGKMPKNREQKFANLRAFLGYMFGHPGKKLLFMGCEFAQELEWNHDAELDWSRLAEPLNAGVQRLVQDLNQLLRETPALHRCDVEPRSFEWIEVADRQRSRIAFLRLGNEDDPPIIVVSNFTPITVDGYRVGVPAAGVYRERLNTDSAYYGGSNFGLKFGAATAEAIPAHGRAYSIVLRLPPLSTVFLAPVDPSGGRDEARPRTARRGRLV